MKDTGRRMRTPAASAARTPGSAGEGAGREASVGNRRREGMGHEGMGDAGMGDAGMGDAGMGDAGMNHEGMGHG